MAIYDLDEEDTVPFIVMEFLDGLDLKYFRTAKTSFAIPQILNMIIQIADGLEYGHRHGIMGLRLVRALRHPAAATRVAPLDQLS